MNIRIMEEKDLDTVSSICMDSFLKSVATDLTEEGVLTFAKISASAAFLHRMKENNVMLVADNGVCIEGVIELKEGRHVAMLFVKPEYQKKGVGRQLLSSVLDYAKVNTITVNASLSSISAYLKYGFECRDDIAEVSGLMYQPMEMIRDKSI